jgi:hypothetical protein
VLREGHLVTAEAFFDPEKPTVLRDGRTIEAGPTTQTGVPALRATEELDQNPIDSLVSTAEKFPIEAPEGDLPLPGLRAVSRNGAAANEEVAVRRHPRDGYAAGSSGGSIVAPPDGAAGKFQPAGNSGDDAAASAKFTSLLDDGPALDQLGGKAKRASHL